MKIENLPQTVETATAIFIFRHVELFRDKFSIVALDKEHVQFKLIELMPKCQWQTLANLRTWEPLAAVDGMSFLSEDFIDLRQRFSILARRGQEILPVIHLVKN